MHAGKWYIIRLQTIEMVLNSTFPRQSLVHRIWNQLRRCWSNDLGLGDRERSRSRARRDWSLRATALRAIELLQNRVTFAECELSCRQRLPETL